MRSDEPETQAQRVRRRFGVTRRADDRVYDRLVRARRGDLSEAARIRSSHKWRKLRARKLRDTPLCEGWTPDGSLAHDHDQVTVLATEVDHIEELRERPDLGYVWSNLQSLCSRCHALKSADERRRRHNRRRREKRRRDREG